MSHDGNHTGILNAEEMRMMVKQRSSQSVEDHYRQRAKDNAAAARSKADLDVAKYEARLKEMVDYTLSLIDENTTSEQLSGMLTIGDKEWKSVCAKVRATKKHLRFNIDAYKNNVVAILIENKILTIPGSTSEITEGNNTIEDVAEITDLSKEEVDGE